jgi:hypothetical protein
MGTIGWEIISFQIILRVFGFIRCSSKATSLNRNITVWGVFGFASPIIAMIWIQFMKPHISWNKVSGIENSTPELSQQIKKYPWYFQSTLTKAVERGESIEEAYEDMNIGLGYLFVIIGIGILIIGFSKISDSISQQDNELLVGIFIFGIIFIINGTRLIVNANNSK